MDYCRIGYRRYNVNIMVLRTISLPFSFLWVFQMARPTKLGLTKDKTAIYGFRVPKTLLADWKAFVVANSDTAQEGLRAAMRTLLGQKRTISSGQEAFVAPPARTAQERCIEAGRKKRIQLLLTESEHKALAEIAESKECSIQYWLVGLIRAVLIRGITVGGAELKALGESNYQLMAIGRNLNQIAHQINADPGKHLHKLRAEQIDALAVLVDDHRRKTHAVILSCSERWEIG